MTEQYRIGVVLCNCAGSLNKSLHFPKIMETLGKEEGVFFVKEYETLCSENEISGLISEVKERKIERVLIGSCSPKLYEELFKGRLIEAGIDGNLVAVCNIREQCAWVINDIDEATKKALSILRGALKRIRKADPVPESEFSPQEEVLIIGGGIGGIQTAIELSNSGFKVTVVEKEKELGGNVKRLNRFYQSEISPEKFVEKKIEEIKGKAEILTASEIISLKGSCGDFVAGIKAGNSILERHFGAVVVATGFETAIPDEFYTLKHDKMVITQLELEKILKNQDETQKIFGRGEEVKVLFVTGMTERFSKLSTGTALKNSLLLKKNYNNRVFLACRNVLVAGEGMENLYRRTRDEGVIVFKFEDKKPQFFLIDDKLIALVYDYYLSSKTSEDFLYPVIKIPCDILVVEEDLSPSVGYGELKSILNIDFDFLNFFQKNNVYYFPVESNRKGIFFVGACRGIEEISDVITDAKGAGIKVFELLKGKIKCYSERMAVDKGKCTLCLTCQRVCPHSAITYTRAAVISEVACQACGVCASECPNSAITLRTYTDEGIIAEIESYI